MKYKMVSQREIIEDIRKRYGIGLQTDSESKEVIKTYRSGYYKALKLISDNLYSEKTHFILELIQNADDNDYADSVTPSLKFAIDYKKILVQNNEKGFTEKNVRALCDVGQSTKSKALGYIGEKGIGFKSVFRVSNEPQIFSNGFHFSFKHEDEYKEFGFIVPYWIDKTPEYIDERLTNIILPLRDEVKEELSKFNEIEPTLLLFLRKLKRIEIHNNIENKTNIWIKQERSGKVEIKHSNKHSKGKERWKLVRESLRVPKYIQEEKRKDVRETELVLTFPLKPDGSADTTKKQKVFAFLPTRLYGFKFIIQADFLVTASREDIDKDKEWNKWLRDNIASVFLKAVEEFKQDEELKKTFYNYIPIADEVNDPFFSSVVEQIHSALREAQCILTESGNWLKPADVFIADGDGIRKLISNDDLKRLHGKEYVSKKIRVGDEVRKALKIQSLEFQHLLQCLQETKWLRKQSDKWFTKLYTYLYNQRLEKEQIQDLKTLRIIRLENNELESISEGNIFFPLNSRENYEFEKELRITKKSLLEVKENKGIYGFLKKLGVQEADPYGIIENHILPVYENYDKTTSRLNKETRTLLGYIRYIKENLKAYEKESNKQLNANKDSWEEKEDPLGRLKNCLLFRTNKTNKSTIYYGKPENIYLPKAYDNGNDLESLFEGIEGISFLHREYIDDTPRKHRRLKQRSKVKLQRTDGMKVKEWKEFFVKLRVNEGLKIIDDYEDFDPDGYYKKDIQPDCWIEYFERIVDGRELEKIKKLILLVESQWIKIKNKMLREIAKRSDGRYKFSYTSVPTRLNKQLTDSEWLPTTEGTLARPSEIFVDKHEIKTILGDGVPYLAVNIKNKELIKALGINLEVNVETVLNHLETLIGQGCKDKSTFEKLYDFLDKRYKNNEKLIKTTFSENPIIYIPDTAQSYFNSKEVLWKDLGDIFGSNRGYLEKHYSKLKSFFVEKLKVSEKPEPRDYANMLIDLSRKENIDEKDEKIILKIYEELENNWFLISTEEWKAFIKEPIFWTDKEEFRYNQDDVFVNDNQELYELFKDNPQLAFLKLPENYYPKLQHFIEVVKISYLSKAVKTKLATGETPRIEQHLTEQIRGLAPYIFRYLYQSEYQIYEKLKSDRVLTKLTNLICYAVERLEVEYILNQQSVSDQRSAILYNGNLYVQNDQQLKDYLAVELSKLFKEVKGLDDFINLLLSKKSEYEIGNLLKAKRIQQLPPGEQEWFGMVKPVSVKEGLVDAEEQTTIKVEHEQIIHSEAASINLIERKMLKSQINTTIPKPLIIEKTKWQPEVEPEEAEISIEEFIPKTKKNKVLPGVREIASRHFLNKFDEEDEDDDKARDILSSEEKRAIGRWGEEYVLKCLKNKLIEDYSKGKLKKTKDGFVIYLGRQKVAEVHWLNKEEDRGEGYDITIIENGNEKYIEVKSTKTDTKEWFDISRRQWEFAQEKGDKFHIYRVYAAGTKHARLMDIVNPIKFWQEGDLIAYPIRISI